MNKYTTKTLRKAKAPEKLIEIRNLIKDGYTTGKAPVEPDVSDERFNLSTFTLKQAMIYFLNYKNGTTTGTGRFW